jgi:hypothetical protein
VVALTPPVAPVIFEDASGPLSNDLGPWDPNGLGQPVYMDQCSLRVINVRGLMSVMVDDNTALMPSLHPFPGLRP